MDRSVHGFVYVCACSRMHTLQTDLQIDDPMCRHMGRQVPTGRLWDRSGLAGGCQGSFAFHFEGRGSSCGLVLYCDLAAQLSSLGMVPFERHATPE